MNHPKVYKLFLKRLLNHKMEKNDVTAGYIITNDERLRRPIQQISNYILSKYLDAPPISSS
jgi:hypothetical protein